MEDGVKVIFLDIDGVMNRIIPEEEDGDGSVCEEPSVRPVEEGKVRLLAELVSRTGAKIVLHSGWRFLYDEAFRPVHPQARRLEALLGKYGLSFYGCTPDLTDEQIRRTKKFSRVKGREILQWLEGHVGPEKVDSWVVLDDLELSEEEVRAHQLRTDGRKGMTEDDVETAVRVLSGRIPIRCVKDSP